MFAVLKTGGKQYRVQPGDVLRVEKLAAEAGETVQFNDVLLVGGDVPVVGAPFVAGAGVQATVIDQIKGEKLIHYVKRRRKHSSQRKKGHRQQLTLLRVTDILAEGAGNSGVKAALGASQAARNGASAPKAAPARSTSETTSSGGAPGNLLSEARGGTPDDLKKMSGVGPKLVAQLHEAGVFHFDQIAAWSEDEAAYMDERLGTRGRIQRDNWIEQANGFASEQE